MRLPEIFKNPRIAAITGIVLGLMLGLLVGWRWWPVQYTDGVPETLAQVYQEQYMRMAIDSYGVWPDPDLAAQRWASLGPNAGPLFRAVAQNPGAQDVGAILGFKAAIEARYGSISAALPIPKPAATPSFNWTPFLIVGGILAFGLIGWAAYRYVVKPIFLGKAPTTGEVSAARQAQDINKTAQKTDFASMGLAKPITQTMTTYVLGDDLYDEAFSIDSPSGEYLGQYGMGISDFVGVGESQKVTAFEVWLFEKGDFDKGGNKTSTKVLMSDHALSDTLIRQRLETKGELVLIQPQAQILLETPKLQLLATVMDLEYGEGSPPLDKSYFKRLTLELAIWPKQ